MKTQSERKKNQIDEVRERAIQGERYKMSARAEAKKKSREVSASLLIEIKNAWAFPRRKTAPVAFLSARW